MSTRKISNKKLATGAVLVALSGFVPQPSMQKAHADTATMKITGTFTDGITLSGGQSMKMGKIVATGNTGNVVQQPTKTAPSQTFVSGFQNAGALQGGTFGFNAAQGGRSVAMTVKGIGGITGAITGATKVRLTTLKLTGPFTTAQVFAPATTAKTSDKIAAAKLAGKTTAAQTADIIVGGKVSWAGGIPIGAFSPTITLVVAY